MKTARPEPDEPFAERIERLERELALALHWDRPSILVAVYASELVRADVEAALEAWVREQGQAATRVQVTGPGDPSADVPLLLREWPNRAQTVFFVSGLRWGAPTAWNALNIRREYLVEDRIRAVFWLTEGETAELPLRAPDFWAFRHRVVEFLELPEGSRVARVASDLAWAGFEERLSPGERRARIAFRKQLLSELPESLETAAARAELHYTLGGLHYFGREHVKALEYFQTALELAERVDDVRLRALVLNGLGAVYHDLGRHEEAIAAYQRAIELDANLAAPHNGLGNACRALGRHEEAIAAYQRAIGLDANLTAPYYGLGNVYSDLGRHEEAIAAYRRAIELDANLAAPYNNLGNVYSDLGRHEEAIAAYQRAIELDPNDASCQASVAAACRELGRNEEYDRHVQRARELMASASDYNKACIESVAGNVEAALEHLAKALEKAPGDRTWACRDPDLAFIRDDPRFRALVGEMAAEEITSDGEIHDD